MPARSFSSAWLNRRQVRAVDRIAIERHGMNGLVLMENAGRGCTDTMEALGVSGRIVICCGKGNNGGDGFVIARHLLIRGYAAHVLIFDDPAEFSPDAAANFDTLLRGEAPWELVGVGARTGQLENALSGADWILDGLLGTGAQGAPRTPYAEVIQKANTMAARRLAIDWPSGLDCDTGMALEPTFRADHTCTFVAGKSGARNPIAGAYLGTIHVLDIGVLPCVIDQALREEP